MKRFQCSIEDLLLANALICAGLGMYLALFSHGWQSPFAAIVMWLGAGTAMGTGLLLPCGRKELGAAFGFASHGGILLLLGLVFAAISALQPAGNWGIAVRNGSGAPCALIVTLGTDSERTLRFDDIAAQEFYGSQTLIEEQGSTTIRTIKVVRSDGQERELRLNEELPEGNTISIRIDENLMVSTDIDLDD